MNVEVDVLIGQMLISFLENECQVFTGFECAEQIGDGSEAWGTVPALSLPLEFSR